MGEQMLVGEELVDLLEADLTYAEVGFTQGDLPVHYSHVRRSVVVGTGAARFEEAAGRVSRWDMHRRAGLSVRPSSSSATQDAVAVLRMGRGILGVSAPVRVVYVVDEPHRQGFAYGTLPGHPESGEESFVVALDEDGEARLTITAFSRPSSTLARAGGPVTRAIQAWATNRYLHAV